jgi:hypothetical protein
MIKNKNADIASLRKQLKLPPKIDSQEKEMAETEGEKDEMLKLIMDQNAQLKEMEAEMEKLVKEKRAVKTHGIHSIECSSTLRSEHNVPSINSIVKSTNVSGKDC